MDEIAKTLVAWFAGAARDLPWRKTQDPYAVWVSEIMLQQTQAATVIPYWLRWMTALPTVQALAQAEEPQLLKLWEGLGYYSRVRNLQKAARIILEKHGGCVPSSHAGLLELPGIGAYSAGAIASIAFNQPQPIVDGNVARVLSRVFYIQSDIASKPVKEQLWKIAGQLVRSAAILPSPRPCSALNQGLMELGALICRPEKPDCVLCPLKPFCEACRHGNPAALPNKAKPAAANKRKTVAFLLIRNRRIWLRQRPKGAVNAGFWELPNAPIADLHEKTILNLAEKELGFRPSKLSFIGKTSHSITNNRYLLHCYQADAADASAAGGQWVAFDDLNATPLFSAHARFIRNALADRP